MLTELYRSRARASPSGSNLVLGEAEIQFHSFSSMTNYLALFLGLCLCPLVYQVPNWTLNTHPAAPTILWRRDRCDCSAPLSH